MESQMNGNESSGEKVFSWVAFQLQPLSCCLFQVTGFARHHNISPTGTASTWFGNNMVHRQHILANSTILAGVIVSSHYILFTERQSFAHISPYHFQNPYYRWQSKALVWRTDNIPVWFYFSARQTKPWWSPFCRAKLQGFIRKIKNQNFCSSSIRIPFHIKEIHEETVEKFLPFRPKCVNRFDKNLQFKRYFFRKFRKGYPAPVDYQGQNNFLSF